MRSASELREIASFGGGLEISSEGLALEEVIAIASAGRPKGANLVIVDADRISTEDLISIAKASPGNVTFVVWSD